MASKKPLLPLTPFEKLAERAYHDSVLTTFAPRNWCHVGFRMIESNGRVIAQVYSGRGRKVVSEGINVL